MSKQTYYITTPIYYMSNKISIGNAYPTVLCDVMSRYKKLRGYDVKFLTGTDDHGQKIERMAQAAGKTTQAYVDGLAEYSKSVWSALDCEYDIFMRTTLPFHEKACQKLFRTLYDKGDIYKDEYEGLYCVECETFFKPKQVPDNLCADCGRPLETVREESYFFRQSKYADILLKHIEDNPGFIRPESRKNEMVNFIKGGLEDIAVTRTTVKWGIPVDFDPKHSIYVWFDALPNYATALGYMGDDDTEYKKYWPADVHVVGKDILRFHTILWPTMLLALGEPLPKSVFGTGWLLVDGGKMSKSKGNVIDPVDQCAKYGSDAVRYFLMREIVAGLDGNYTEEALAARFNADLSNDLGNLLSRTAGMTEKYFGGTIPETQSVTSFDDALVEVMKSAVGKAAEAMEQMMFSDALSEIWTMIRRANKYVDETEPWLLHRNNETGALARVLYLLAEALRRAAVLVSPFMPRASREIFRQLGVDDEKLMTWESIETGKLPSTVTLQKGESLFPRIDIKAVFGEKDEPEAPKIPQITIEDFAKLDLRVGIVKECVKASEKLLKSQVDIGGEVRQILSGIAQWYEPAEMEGKRVAVITNLKPIKLRGFMSEGMILAAGEGTEDDPVRLVTVEGDQPAGTKIR